MVVSRRSTSGTLKWAATCLTTDDLPTPRGPQSMVARCRRVLSAYCSIKAALAEAIDTGGMFIGLPAMVFLRVWQQTRAAATQMFSGDAAAAGSRIAAIPAA